MTIDEVTLDRPANRNGLQRYLLIPSVETLPVRLGVFHWDLGSFRLVPALGWTLGIGSLFLTILLYNLQVGIWILLPFCDDQYFFGIDSSRIKSWCVQFFRFLRYLLSEYLLSKFLPRSSSHPRKNTWSYLLAKIYEVLIGLLELKSDAIQLIAPIRN